MGRSEGEERWREAVVDLHCRWMAAGDKRPDEMLMADGETVRAELIDGRYAAMLGKQAVAKVERVLRANPDKGCLRFHCSKPCRDGRLCHGENLAEAGRCIQRKWLEERRTASGAPAHEIGTAWWRRDSTSESR